MAKRKFYLMKRLVPYSGAIIYKANYDSIIFKQGYALKDDMKKSTPVRCTLDEDKRERRLPTFFESPALIATKEFYQLLKSCSITNIEWHPAIITDPNNKRKIKSYGLINIVGAVKCINNNRIRENMKLDRMARAVVIHDKKAPDLDIFLTAENTDNIIISDRLFQVLSKKAPKDVGLIPLEVT